MTITPDDAIDRDIYEFAQVLFAMLTGITTGVLPKNERLPSGVGQETEIAGRGP